jgi:hypothetical protein
MMQTIKDLANAFVPSGKLVEMVDKALVSPFFFFSQEYTNLNTFPYVPYLLLLFNPLSSPF